MKTKCPIVLLIFTAALLSSCSGNFFSNDVTVGVRSTETTNCGFPLYMLVKEVERVEFLTDSYPCIAKEFFSSPRTPSYVLSKVILPGNLYKMKIPRKEGNKCIAIYFLFTDMGEKWKLAVDPAVDKLEIVLGEREINFVKGM